MRRGADPGLELDRGTDECAAPLRFTVIPGPAAPPRAAESLEAMLLCGGPVRQAADEDPDTSFIAALSTGMLPPLWELLKSALGSGEATRQGALLLALGVRPSPTLERILRGQPDLAAAAAEAVGIAQRQLEALDARRPWPRFPRRRRCLSSGWRRRRRDRGRPGMIRWRGLAS